jgi:hypothetical protein
MNKIRDEIVYCIWQTIAQIGSYKTDFIKIRLLNNKLHSLMSLLDDVEELIKEYNVNW